MARKEWKVRQSALHRAQSEARSSGEPFGIVAVKGTLVVRPLRKALRIKGTLLEEVMP